MESGERRTSHNNNRQIDRIEAMLQELVLIMHGEGEDLGIKGKVSIMWGYRNLFVGVIVANMFTILFFVINTFRGN